MYLSGIQSIQKTFGFPITDFGNDGGGGCLIEDFRHDRKG